MKRDCLSKGDVVCKLISPHDPYTLRAQSFEVAAVAIGRVFRGAYGVCTVDESRYSPAISEQGLWNRDNPERWGYDCWVGEHLVEIADCLDSLVIGTPDQRVEVEQIAESPMSDSDFKWWFESRLNRLRSSTRNIAAEVEEVAKKIRTGKMFLDAVREST